MIITQTIKIDLLTNGILPTLNAMQGDSNTRAIKIDLVAGGQEWIIPDGVTTAVAFLKPDGKKGLYDKLPDGNPATLISGSSVTAFLAPQVLTCPGTVLVSVTFYDLDGDSLATFPFRVITEPNPAVGQIVSNDYYNPSIFDIDAAQKALAKQVKELEDAVSKLQENTSSLNVVTYDIASMALPNLTLNGDPLEIEMDTAEFTKIHAASIVAFNLNVEYKGMIVENTKVTFLPNGNVATNNILLARFFVSLFWTEGKVVLRADLDESSWNDLSDKPFYEESSTDTLLWETEYPFQVNTALGCYAHTLTGMPFTFVDGKAYKIHWDNEEYVRTAFSFTSADGSACVAVGNPIASGGESNNDSFAIIVDTTHKYVHFCSIETLDSHKVAIYQDTTVVKTIDAKFLPSAVSVNLSGFESNGKIVETYADGSVVTTVMEFDANGKPTKITDSNGNVTVLTW
jgi:hypothetical protein